MSAYCPIDGKFCCDDVCQGTGTCSVLRQPAIQICEDCAQLEEFCECHHYEDDLDNEDYPS